MVLPLLVVGAAGAIGYFAYNEKTGTLEQIGEEAADALGGAVEVAVEELGDLVGNVGNSLLDFIKGFGIAVLEGAQDTVDYMVDTAKPYRVPVAQTITSLAIWFAASLVIYRMVTKVN